jgi:hypothetical protein
MLRWQKRCDLTCLSPPLRSNHTRNAAFWRKTRSVEVGDDMHSDERWNHERWNHEKLAGELTEAVKQFIFEQRASRRQDIALHFSISEELATRAIRELQDRGDIVWDEGGIRPWQCRVICSTIGCCQGQA